VFGKRDAAMKQEEEAGAVAAAALRAVARLPASLLKQLIPK
jgi:hypothetical protein